MYFTSVQNKDVLEIKLVVFGGSCDHNMAVPKSQFTPCKKKICIYLVTGMTGLIFMEKNESVMGSKNNGAA